MDTPLDLQLVGGLTLHELLQSLEDSDDDGHNGLALTMLPPTNACEPVTDEDSGDENYVNINNLPGSQLRAEAEIFYGDSKVTNPTNIPKRISVTDNNLDGTDSEDNIPLMELRGRMKKRKIEVKKKSYKWVAKDLIPEEVQFPCQQNVLKNNSPSELFSFFWSDNVIEMFVTYSNLYATSKNKVGNITKEEMKNFFAIFCRFS
ncbi:hypothetical protein JTB14_021522 [Gonioctena quinquepunctata]|nr:hypothetical protein JTB14_021522 [Gonioctena quinquepunctata]